MGLGCRERVCRVWGLGLNPTYIANRLAYSLSGLQFLILLAEVGVFMRLPGA